MKSKRLFTLATWILMALIVTVPLLTGACAQPAPTTAPAKPPAATPAPSPVAAAFTIKYGSHVTAAGPMSKAHDWFMTQVEQRSGGRVKFERYWSESLAPAKEMIGAISSGAADSGYVIASYQPSKVPLLTMAHLPVLVSDIYPAVMAMRDLYQQVPAMNEELTKNNMRPMAYIAWSTFELLTTKPVNTLDDLKGMKLRAMGDTGQVAKALGAIPVEMAAPEVNEGMARGTIDGTIMNPSAVLSYSLHDVGKYYWRMPFGGALALMAINQKKWDSLPADIQQIIKQVDLEFAEPLHRTYQIQGEGAGVELMKTKGLRITSPTAVEIARVRQVARDVVWNNWAKSMEDKGLPAKKALDTFVSLQEKYAATSPFK